MGFALMFSRSPIPYDREKCGQFNSLSYKHLGLYAYRKDFLEDFTKIPFGDLENLEKLEQLRALENGKRIAVEIIDHGTIGVDTREDLMEIEFD
jgi:3-deoxy-manno-octulosonate cytidylyltransferase (CMP-KDO synthetase)